MSHTGSTGSGTRKSKCGMWEKSISMSPSAGSMGDGCMTFLADHDSTAERNCSLLNGFIMTWFIPARQAYQMTDEIACMCQQRGVVGWCI